jgi:hypothetical protein
MLFQEFEKWGLEFSYVIMLPLTGWKIYIILSDTEVSVRVIGMVCPRPSALLPVGQNELLILGHCENCLIYLLQ